MKPTEYTFVYDDSTLTIKMDPKDAEIVIDAMHNKGWTLKEDHPWWDSLDDN